MPTKSEVVLPIVYLALLRVTSARLRWCHHSMVIACACVRRSRKTNTSDFQVSISHDFGMNPKMLDLGPGLQCAFFQWPGVTGAILFGVN
eukprot:scaffold2192_cov143-Skeletonema_marinoi.AAC.6